MDKHVEELTRMKDDENERMKMKEGGKRVNKSLCCLKAMDGEEIFARVVGMINWFVPGPSSKQK